MAPLVKGWGEDDHVCLPRQAALAMSMFPECTTLLVSELRPLPPVGQPRTGRAFDTRSHLRRSIASAEERGQIYVIYPGDMGFSSLASSSNRCYRCLRASEI